MLLIGNIGQKRHSPLFSLPGKTFDIVAENERFRLSAGTRIGMIRRRRPAKHHARSRESGMLQSVQRKHGMVEAAESVGHHQQYGKTQFPHEVEHAFLFVQRHIQTARPFKKRDAIGKNLGPACCGQRSDIEPSAFQSCGQMRRTGNPKGRKHTALPSGFFPELHIGSEQTVRPLDAARLHGLHGTGRNLCFGKGSQKPRRNGGLARVGIRARYEKRIHAFTPSVRIMARSASNAAPDVVR